MGSYRTPERTFRPGKRVTSGLPPARFGARTCGLLGWGLGRAADDRGRDRADDGHPPQDRARSDAARRAPPAPARGHGRPTATTAPEPAPCARLLASRLPRRPDGPAPPDR